MCNPVSYLYWAVSFWPLFWRELAFISATDTAVAMSKGFGSMPTKLRLMPTLSLRAVTPKLRQNDCRLHIVSDKPSRPE